VQGNAGGSKHKREDDRRNCKVHGTDRGKSRRPPAIPGTHTEHDVHDRQSCETLELFVVRCSVGLEQNSRNRQKECSGIGEELDAGVR
jgi:hypothetical protein